MPSETLKHFEDITNRTMPELEILWDKAKKQAKDKFSSKDNRYYPYAMGIMKRMVGVSSLEDHILSFGEVDLASGVPMAGVPVLRDSPQIQMNMIASGAVGWVDITALEFLLLSAKDFTLTPMEDKSLGVDEYNLMVDQNILRTGVTLLVDITTGTIKGNFGEGRARALLREGGPFALMSSYIILVDENAEPVQFLLDEKGNPNRITEDEVPSQFKTCCGRYVWQRPSLGFHPLDAHRKMDVRNVVGLEDLAGVSFNFHIPNMFTLDIKGGWVKADGSKFYKNIARNGHATTASRLLPGTVDSKVWYGDNEQAAIDSGCIKVEYYQSRNPHKFDYSDSTTRSIIITGTTESLASNTNTYRAALAIVDYYYREFEDDISVTFVLEGFATNDNGFNRDNVYTKVDVNAGSFEHAHMTLRRLISRTSKIVMEKPESVEVSITMNESKPSFLQLTPLLDTSGWLVPYCINTGRILIAKRNKTFAMGDMWAPVGGSSNSNEVEIITAIREAAEELNFNVDYETVNKLSEITYKDSLANTVYNAHVFTTLMEGEARITLNYENEHAIWIEPELMLNARNVSPLLKDILYKVIAYKHQIIYNISGIKVLPGSVPGLTEEGGVLPDNISWDIIRERAAFTSTTLCLYDEAAKKDNDEPTLIGKVRVTHGIETLHDLVIDNGYRGLKLGNLLVHLCDCLAEPPMRLRVKSEDRRGIIDNEALVEWYTRFGYALSREDAFIEMRRSMVGRGYGNFMERYYSDN